MSDEDRDVTLMPAAVAAGLLRELAGDRDTFLRLLAHSLEATVGERVRVEYQGGWFGRKRRVRRIRLDLGDYRYECRVDGEGSIAAGRTHVVRNVALRTDELPVPEWLEALSEALVDYARTNEAALAARPLELAMGNCVYHVERRGFRQALSQWGRNVEMPNYTQALYGARELALERMQAEAESAGAHGIVGVKLQQSHHTWSNHVIEFFAVGTAIVRGPATEAVAPPQLVLSLNDAPPRPVEQSTPRPATGGKPST